MDNRKELYNSIMVKVPYPPTVTAEELFKSRKRSNNGKSRSKVSNSFLVYRGEYYKELKKTHHGIPQYMVSRMASNSWKHEPKHIKEAYLNIAGDLDKLFLESNKKANVQFQPLPQTSATSIPIFQEIEVNPDLIYIQGESPIEENTFNCDPSQYGCPCYTYSQYEGFFSQYEGFFSQYEGFFSQEEIYFNAYQDVYLNYFCQEELDWYTYFMSQPEQLYFDANWCHLIPLP
ncbi:18540_t:CDS:1, partial [Acaulospora morrowiae]